MDKNTRIITGIIEHIENVFASQKRFGNDYKVFVSDKDYFNSACMSLIQIGELANHLTTDFISAHSAIPWKNITGLRNVIVHGYGQLDTEIVWATIIDDIPDLYEKCKTLLRNC
jgi:uncharacterized protein with HEPN domain